jgi:MtN3 and saliva related transmembrane protein
MTSELGLRRLRFVVYGFVLSENTLHITRNRKQQTINRKRLNSSFFYVRLPPTILTQPLMSVDVLGYIAGAITALTFLPQVIKTWREKSAKDISLLMFLIAAANEILWIIYGVILDNWVIILTNTVVLAMSLTMIYLKLRYNKK